MPKDDIKFVQIAVDSSEDGTIYALDDRGRVFTRVNLAKKFDDDAEMAWVRIAGDERRLLKGPED